MIGTILQLIRPGKPLVDDWQPSPVLITGPDDGELVGEYNFGRAWAKVSLDGFGNHELAVLYGDKSVPKRGSALLRYICERADVLGCVLVIQVVPPFERRSDAEKARLWALYAKCGFGAYPGREPGKLMMRNPRSVNSDETPIDEIT